MTFPRATPFGITVKVIRRPKRDRTGDPINPADPGADYHHTISGVAVDWGDQPDENTDRREQPLTTIGVYVPKGSDLLAADLVELPDGVELRIVGRGRWNQQHAMNGFDFGYVLYRAKES